MNEARELLTLLGGFSEREYLSFLKERVPDDLANDLEGDAAPDLGLAGMTGEDLIQPLFSLEFPRKDSPSTPSGTPRITFSGIKNELSFTLTGYNVDWHDERDSFKSVNGSRKLQRLAGRKGN